ncbi:MAG: O-antigen ligase family protein [Patescibacteria group bacterium]
MSLVRNIFNYLILGMAVAIPFLVFPVFENSYEFPKILIFKFCVSVLFGLKMLELKSWHDIGLWIKNLFLKKRKWPVVLFCAFFVSQLVSVILSIDRERSLWGSPERWWGLTTQISFFVFFFLLFDFFAELKNRKNFLIAVAVSATAMSVYAIIQRLGLTNDDFVYTRGFNLPRPDGTLGHPNYLGIYLAMSLPVLYYFLFFTKKVILKIVCSLAIFLILIALHNTINRGGYLAAYFSAIIFFSFYFCKISERKNRWQKLSLSFLSATLVFLCFWTGIFLPKGQAPSEQNFGEGSMLIRILDMGAAADYFYQKPFFGYGAENYLLLYEKRAKWPIEQVIDNHPSDRVHNLFFDNLLNFGFVGVVLLFFFWFEILKNIYHQIISVDWIKKINALLLLAIFFAYLVALQFHFDTLVVTFLLYSFWAYSLADGESFVDQKNKLQLSILILGIVAIIFGFFLLAVCLL